MIPVFVINLPKDTVRRAFMQEQLERLGFEYEIVPGFYGDDPRVLESCDDELSRKEHGKPLTRAEKGCAYSHSLLYKKMLNENIATALVLEDDVVLPENFKLILEKTINNKTMSWDWLSFDYPSTGYLFFKEWLEASFSTIKTDKWFFFYFLLKLPYMMLVSVFEELRNRIALKIARFRGPKNFYRPLYNASAYVVTREGVRKLLPLISPIRFSADRLPNQARVRYGLNYKGYVPLLVRQDKTFESNIKSKL